MKTKSDNWVFCHYRVPRTNKEVLEAWCLDVLGDSEAPEGYNEYLFPFEAWLSIWTYTCSIFLTFYVDTY